MEAVFLAPAVDVVDDQQPTVGQINGAGAPKARTSRRNTSRRTGRSRAVVLEPAAAPVDRLEHDLDVVARTQVLPPPELLSAFLNQHRPRFVLLKYPLDSIDERLMAACLEYRARILVLAQPTYGLLSPNRLYRLGGLPWIRLSRGSAHPAADRAKRCIDVALTLLSVPLSVPLMVMIMALVGAGGRPLYVQYRVGLDGRTFGMIKFRTMRVDAERETGPVLATEYDGRVTRVGRVLRRLRLDELPQLWNVLRGDMSLVGPRPERPEFAADHLRLPHYHLRGRVRPGLTGIAQLTGGYAATVEEKLRCDLFYMNCRTLRLDLKLLLLTLIEFLRGFPRG